MSNVTGVHLLSTGQHRLEVRVEVDGKWRTVITESVESVGGMISHIAEPLSWGEPKEES